MKHGRSLSYDEAWEEGRNTASQNFKSANGTMQSEKNTATEGGVKYKTIDVSGKKIVLLESSPLSSRQLMNPSEIAKYIASHVGEVYTILESGKSVYLEPDLPNEYAYSKYTQYLRKTDRTALRAKNKAVDSLGEMIEIASNRRAEATHHQSSKDAKYGMYRYDTSFAFPIKDRNGSIVNIRVYDAELLIRNASDFKKYLYDIVNIKEDTASANVLINRENRSAAYAATRGSASIDSISDISGKSNTSDEKNISTAVDTDGKSLSEGQQKYFAGSKVRDADGKLRVMYQGSTEEFTVFDKKKSKPSNLYGRGFYFTDSKAHASQYGNARAYYLNITNPPSNTENSISKSQLTKFVAEIAENEDYGIENYSYENFLVNKQIIKTGIDDIPNSYLSTITKKQSKNDFLADLNKVRKEHAQSVNQFYSTNSIRNDSEKIKMSDEKSFLRGRRNPTLQNLS